MRFTCLLFILLVFGSVTINAQEDYDQYGRWINGVTEPWTFYYQTYTKDEAKTFQQKWKLIAEQNLQDKSNEWAGDYVRGDLHKKYLRWSPDGSFAYVNVFTCSTEVLGINYGPIAATPAFIKLNPELKMSAQRHDKYHGGHTAYMLPQDYLPVKWGSVHYLVEKNRVANFYKMVAGIDEDQGDDDFFVKVEDYGKSPEGMPIFPAEYDRFVRRPIEGKIVAVGKKWLRRERLMDGTFSYDSLTPVEINVGKANGLRRGMFFYVVGSRFSDKVEVTKVRLRSASGVILRFVDDDKQEKGWNVDTRLHEVCPPIKSGSGVTTSVYLSKQW